MSSDVLNSWLRVRRVQAKFKSLLTASKHSPSSTSSPTVPETNGNRVLHNRGARRHHRIYWREEATLKSIWAGAQKAIAVADAHEQDPIPLSGTEEVPAASDGETSTPPGCPASTLTTYTAPSTCTVADILQKISQRSDLERLDHLLKAGQIDVTCPDTVAVALQDGNPAVVETLLSYGRENVTSYTRIVRSWGQHDGEGQSRPRLLPLHAGCHSGSHVVTSVLLDFLREACSSDAERLDMLNARDHCGRTALHIASWSPRTTCPGKRHATIRILIAHGARVDVKDNSGKTPLHEACRAGDRFAVQILLESGADPLEEDDRARTPVEAAGRKSRSAMGQVFKKQLSQEELLRLLARITARRTVTRLMQQFEAICDVCRVRPASKCAAQERESFAAWLYTHNRLPKAGEGVWGDVRPSCVEKIASDVRKARGDTAATVGSGVCRRDKDPLRVGKTTLGAAPDWIDEI